MDCSWLGHFPLGHLVGPGRGGPACGEQRDVLEAVVSPPPFRQQPVGSGDPPGVALPERFVAPVCQQVRAHPVVGRVRLSAGGCDPEVLLGVVHGV